MAFPRLSGLDDLDLVVRDVILVIVAPIIVAAIIMAGVVLVAVSMIGVPVIVHRTIRSMEDAVLDRVSLAWFAAADVAAPPSFSGAGPMRAGATVPTAGCVPATAGMVVLGKGRTQDVKH